MLPLDEKEIASFKISSYSAEKYSIIFTRFTWIHNDISIIHKLLRKYFSHKFCKFMFYQSCCLRSYSNNIFTIENRMNIKVSIFVWLYLHDCKYSTYTLFPPLLLILFDKWIEINLYYFCHFLIQYTPYRVPLYLISFMYCIPLVLNIFPFWLSF